MNVAVVMLAQPVTELIGRAPELGAAIKEKLQILDRPIAAFYELQTALGFGSTGPKVDVSHSRVLEGMVTVVTPAAVQFVMQLVLFFGTLFFFIIGRAEFRKYALNWFADPGGAAARAQDPQRHRRQHGRLPVRGHGDQSVARRGDDDHGLCASDLPAPLLWGALAFGLNYIPYVGPAIMYVLLFVIGIMTYPTFLGAMLPPGIFMAITLIEGQFLSPAIVGRQRAVDPSAVDLPRHRILGLAVGPDGRVPGDADPDRRPRRLRSPLSAAESPNCRADLLRAFGIESARNSPEDLP